MPNRQITHKLYHSLRKVVSLASIFFCDLRICVFLAQLRQYSRSNGLLSGDCQSFPSTISFSEALVICAFPPWQELNGNPVCKSSFARKGEDERRQCKPHVDYSVVVLSSRSMKDIPRRIQVDVGQPSAVVSVGRTRPVVLYPAIQPVLKHYVRWRSSAGLFLHRKVKKIYLS